MRGPQKDAVSGPHSAGNSDANGALTGDALSFSYYRTHRADAVVDSHYKLPDRTTSAPAFHWQYNMPEHQHDAPSKDLVITDEAEDAELQLTWPDDHVETVQEDSSITFPKTNPNYAVDSSPDLVESVEPSCNSVASNLHDRDSEPVDQDASSEKDFPDGVEQAEVESCYSLDPDEMSTLMASGELKPIEVVLPESKLLVPCSHYEPFEPPAPPRKEREALNILLPLAESFLQPDEDFIDLQLDDFAVYSDKKYYGVEMRPLHQLDSGNGNGNFYFDGKVSAGDKSFFIRGAPIISMPIGNYGTVEEHTVRDSIWLCTSQTSSRGVYYRLGKPAKEYKRFFEPFLWVADLAKHFVDYVKAMDEDGKKVTIHHFRSAFASWLDMAHGQAPEFLQWRSQYRSENFCTSLVANMWFLYKEAIGVLGETVVYRHTLWDEISLFRRYKEPPKYANLVDDLSTVVTPYILDCFEHLPFGDRLKSMPLSPKTEALRTRTIQNRRLQLPTSMRVGHKDLSTVSRDMIQAIKAGDTISTHRDSEDSGSKWKREVSKGFSDVDRWFALVQSVHVNSRGRRSFDVTWYYRPVDTICGLMKYPWNNELFISDHCSCGHNAKIIEDEVIGVHQIDFGGSPTTINEFFCRQVYIHEERKWITLDIHQHLMCDHVRAKTNKPSSAESEYSEGDTLLVHIDRSGDRSEPCEFVATEYNEAGSQWFQLRRLLRRREVDHSSSFKARPNELVYTNTLVKVRPSVIMGRCHVRYFKQGEEIPTPYDRDGVGAHFFFSTELQVAPNGEVSCEPMGDVPLTLRQGYDPKMRLPRLRGLDLFCGGGNFGRGLDDGGGIEMKWANDYATKAIHTYMANVPSPDSVHPFLGSIDILHSLAIQGRFSKSVPSPGEVDFLSGGSPCPGFSRLTNDKTTVQQRKNQSLVAAFAASVDLYRPKYGLLENVIGIVQSKSNRDQDVFSQLICAVVGLGYQTQFFFLDASSCGSPQRRSRVFLAFAAPGCKLPNKPLQTHTHPPYTKAMNLGKLPNGESMAEREMLPAAPFKFVTAEEALGDLPSIYDGKPDICVPYPDHRVVIGMTKLVRLELAHIPTHPFGMNFARAWYGLDPRKPKPGSGVLTESERHSFFPKGTTSYTNCVGPNSNAYGRQRPDRLIGTIVTKQGPRDAKQGSQLHWYENRTLTLLEARRAQGFRDHEVLLGSVTEQYKVVGNSVAREVAVALGIAFREAWAETFANRPKRDLSVEIAAAGVVVIDDDDSPIEEGTAADTEATRSVFDTGTHTPGTATPTTIGLLTSDDEVQVVSDISKKPNGHKNKKREMSQSTLLSDAVTTAAKKRRVVYPTTTSMTDRR